MKKSLDDRSKERKFWNWFLRKADFFYHLEENEDYLFQLLLKRLSIIDENLTFEFSPILENGKREFIISADGIVTSFPSVQKLVGCAPRLHPWEIIAFRQPKPPEYSNIEYEGVEIDLSEVYFQYKARHLRLDLEIYLPTYQGENYWEPISYLIMDSVLGEYDTEMYLGEVYLNKLRDHYQAKLRPVSELHGIVKHFKQQWYN